MTTETRTTTTMTTTMTTTGRTKRPADLPEGGAGSGTLLTLTLGCYAAALVCVLTLCYSLAVLAAHDLGRQAAVIVSPYSL